jgi:hypothetical protein
MISCPTTTHSASLTQIFSGAIEAYRSQRRGHLILYPTVAETLLKIKGAGARIIGYTESLAFYSNYRVRRLGLDGVFDYIFSRKDHDIPASLSRDAIRRYPASHYEFRYTARTHDVGQDCQSAETGNNLAQQLIRPRLGQGAFRVGVTDVYQRRAHARDRKFKRDPSWSPPPVRLGSNLRGSTFTRKSPPHTRQFAPDIANRLMVQVVGVRSLLFGGFDFDAGLLGECRYSGKGFRSLGGSRGARSSIGLRPVSERARSSPPSLALLTPG